MDQALDIVVSPDLSRWCWKDEEELEEAVASGFLSADTALAVRAEGEGVVRRIERGMSPFNEGWEYWKPDPDWSLPQLPEGWEALG